VVNGIFNYIGDFRDYLMMLTNTKQHILKTVNPYFEDIWHKNKNFEIRFNDRDFRISDRLDLVEIDNNGNRTLRMITCYINYICTFEQKEGYVVLGLKDFQNHDEMPYVTKRKCDICNEAIWTDQEVTNDCDTVKAWHNGCGSVHYYTEFKKLKQELRKLKANDR